MSRKPDSAVPAAVLSSDKAEEIRTELERVLASQHFRSSRRCQNLLRHITEQTIAGDIQPLKERTLGIEVFDREPDYDTSQDPVVRATAAEIRKKLAQYYQESARDSEPRIELLSGSYVPEFHFTEAPAPPADPHRRIRRVVLFSLSIVAVIVIALCALFFLRSKPRSPLDQFWAPILDTQGNVIICLGQPVALNLRSSQAQDRMQMRQSQTPKSVTDDEIIPRRDLVILADRYIALGDAECLVRISSLLERHAKPFRIRGEKTTSFADIRENAAVFIAAFDNPWTLRAVSSLRFTFSKDSDHDTDMIRDRLHPENRDWKITGAWPEWNIAADYAIISRVRDANTDLPFVIAAGITHYGTQAAGEFLTNPEYFSEAGSHLPADWARHNLQIVLWVPVVHRAAGHPHILATHVW